MKTYLVFNGLNLETFFLAFAYRQETATPESSFGVFYRCRELDGWFMDGYGVVLGDNSIKLWGVPKDAYTEESQQLGPGFMKRAMMEIGPANKRLRLPEHDGHTCNIRAADKELGHMLDAEFGRMHRLKDGLNKPNSGTIAIEAWIRGQGRLAVEFEGFMVREGKQALEMFRPKKKK